LHFVHVHISLYILSCFLFGFVFQLCV
jgi:hypothetical protein